MGALTPRGQQVLDRPRVVAQHGALAHAEAAAAFDVNDVALGEHRRAGLDRFAAVVDGEVGVDLAHTIRDTIGLLYKVLPTAIVAAAMRPSATKKDLEARADGLIDALRQAGANLAVQSGREAVEIGGAMLADRNIVHVERGGRFRVRERTVLRYYARTIQHLLVPRRQRTH